MTDDWGTKHNGCRVGLGFSSTVELSSDGSQGRIHDFDCKFSSDDPIYDTSNTLTLSGNAITDGTYSNEVNKSSSWSGTMTMRTQSGQWNDLSYGATTTHDANISLSGISYAGATLTSGHTFTYPARAYDLPYAGSAPWISSATSSSVTMYWAFPSATDTNDFGPVTSAMLQCSTDKVNWWNVVSLSQGHNADTWYTHTGLSTGTQYYYRTLGYNSSGYGAASAASEGVWTAPAGPTVGTVTRSADDYITIPWTNNGTGRGSISYNTVYYRVDGGAWSAGFPVSSTATSYVFTGGVADHRYEFTVNAFNAGGAGYGALSNTVYNSVTAPTSAAFGAATVTTNHASGVINGISQTSQATVSWSHANPAYVQAYEVWIDGGKYGADTAATSMLVQGLNAGQTYTAVIKAKHTTGTAYTSGNSNNAYVTGNTLLTAPTGVTLGAFTRLVGKASATLSWNAVAGATSYYVTVVNGTGIPATNVVVGTSVSITDMDAGELTKFSVMTLNNVGYSAPAYSQDGIYSPTVPSAPATVTLGAFTAAAGKSSATLSWTATADTTSYTIAVVSSAGVPSSYSVVGTSVGITNIGPGETARFSVAAVNATGSSPVTLSQAGAVAPTVSASPSTVAVSYNATTSQITLSWLTPPSDGGTPITKYQYQIETQALAGTDPYLVTTAYTDIGLATSVTLAQPWAFNFRVSVRAVNGIGNSTAGLDETGVIGGYVKVWNGTAWVNQFFYVYVADWSKPALVRKFDGTSWVPLT